MRRILNALITFLVFWFGSNYFSEYISIADTKTLILATVFMLVISYVFSWFFILSLLTIPLGVGCITSVFLFMIGIVLNPVKLWLLSSYLPGFNINGFWSYVVLTVVLSVFSIKSRSDSKSKKEKTTSGG